MVAGAAAGHYMDTRRPTSSSSSSGPVASGYVPYADIYGPDADRHVPRQSAQRDSERYPRDPQASYGPVDPHYRAPYVSDHRSTDDSRDGSTRSRQQYRDEEGGRSRRDKSRDRTRTRARSFGPGTLGGAVAGGLVGRGAGGGGILPTMAGAAIGAVGANAYENQNRLVGHIGLYDCVLTWL